MEGFYQVGIKEVQELAAREDGGEELQRVGGSGVEIVPANSDEVEALRLQYSDLLSSKAQKRQEGREWADEFDVPLIWTAYNSRGLWFGDFELSGEVQYPLTLGGIRVEPHLFHSDAYRLGSFDHKERRDEVDFIGLYMPRKFGTEKYEVSSYTVIAEINSIVRGALELTLKDIDKLRDLMFEPFMDYLREVKIEFDEGRDMSVDQFKVLHKRIDTFFSSLWPVTSNEEKKDRYVFVNKLMKFVVNKMNEWGKAAVVRWVPGGILLIPDCNELHARIVEDETVIISNWQRINIYAKVEAELLRYEIRHSDNVDRWVDYRGKLAA